MYKVKTKKINICDKFLLLAFVESQRSILNQSAEEYIRLARSIQKSHNFAAKRVLALIDQNLASLDELKNKIEPLFDVVKLLGNEKCDIDYGRAALSVCYREKDECHAPCQLSKAEIGIDIPNIWAT